MKKLSLRILLATASAAMLAGCQAGSGGGSSSSELDGLCDQYASAMKAGNLEEAQSLTQIINEKNSNKSAGEQLKWTGDCFERHNMTGN